MWCRDGQGCQDWQKTITALPCLALVVLQWAFDHYHYNHDSNAPPSWSQHVVGGSESAGLPTAQHGYNQHGKHIFYIIWEATRIVIMLWYRVFLENGTHLNISYGIGSLRNPGPRGYHISHPAQGPMGPFLWGFFGVLLVLLFRARPFVCAKN